MQNWLITLAIVVVFLGIAVPTAVIVFSNAAADQTQLTVSCTSARSNIEILQALSKFAHQLGVPVTWEIPELPPECAV